MTNIKWMSLIGLSVFFVMTGCNQTDKPADSASAKPPTAIKETAQKPVEPASPKAETAAPEEKTPEADPTPADQGPPRVAMEIGLGNESWGKIVLELNPEKAPITVKNFLRYVDEGYYNGTIFHRIMPNFMIQGGGFESLTSQKTQCLHDQIQNEAKNGLKNERGTIAMARTGAPHSATSQFFINVVDNKSLDYPSFDGWGYCVFGKVIEGMEVVDRVKNVPTQTNPANPREKSQPVNPPVLKKAYRVKTK